MSFDLQQSSQQKELSALYQEVILDHSKHPRHKHKMTSCQFCQEGKNPLCGDQITVFCSLDANRLLTVSFEGSGCSISQASASMMCEALQGKTVHEVKPMLKSAEDIYSGRAQLDDADLENDLEALSGVGKFPVRIKCAALPWKTFEILFQEHFDAQGNPKNPCHFSTCPPPASKKLKVVTTE